jgi:hypothetical protein
MDRNTGDLAVAARLTIVNPVAEPDAHAEGAERFPPANRPATLDGKTVALYWNGKQNGPFALARTKENLSKRFKDIKFVDVVGEKGGTNRYLSENQLKTLAETVDAAVCTTADCGSCTSWLVRDLCELERRGVPAIGFTAAIFDDDAHFSAKVFGVPEAVPVIVPECFSNKDAEDVGKMVDDAMAKVIDGLTKGRKPKDELAQFDKMVLEKAPELHFDGEDLMDACEKMQRQFIKNYWSDGLPLIPPTGKKVDAMIAASGLDGDHVVGKFAPGMGIGTVRKIAANAVMAGCRPDMMPIIMATMECILDSSIGLRTWAMSTGPQFPMIMVSGPYAEKIGMNSGICALGPGSISEVNVVIGRALRLIMMNVGLSYPGITDMDTIGTPGKFSFCVAENEKRNPWAPYRVQQGFKAEDTTVTVNVPYGMTELFDFQNSDPELLIEGWATLSSNAVGSPAMCVWLVKTNAPLEAGYPFHGTYSNVLLMAPDHAAVFAKAGWSIDDMKQAIHRQTRIQFRKAMINKSYEGFKTAHPELSWLMDQPETLVSVNPSADCFEFFVVGATAGRSQYCFGGTNSVTRKVKL